MQSGIKLIVYSVAALLVATAGTGLAQKLPDNPNRAAEHRAFWEYARSMQREANANAVEQTDEPAGMTKQEFFDENNSIFKSSGAASTPGVELRKSYYMNANRIKATIHNYGSVGNGANSFRLTGLTWRGTPYVFQFGPIVAARVHVDPEDTTSEIVTIVSDGIWDYSSQREMNPTGDTLWQWQPLPGYASEYKDVDRTIPNDLMASNPAPDEDEDGKPDSWPREWYNETLGEYVWPGYLKLGASQADLEVLWGMDDRENWEFDYQPKKNDPTVGGLGIKIEGRAFQWSNLMAENAIFVVYTITNVSDYDLDSVTFAIYGDPDVGGGQGVDLPTNTEPNDDKGTFVPPYDYDSTGRVDNVPVYARSLAYFYDDGKGVLGMETDLFGCKFLESPGNPDDGIDNDGDGMIDERQDDGIDNDGDWDPAIDDVGVDGIEDTQDEGEGDGLPTRGKRLADGSLDPLAPGEPNFEYTDLDEADQIGLTSFGLWEWLATGTVKNDDFLMGKLKPQQYNEMTQQGRDLVFAFGAGPISLAKGETKRISMAMFCAETENDFLITAETIQRIYNNNYKFYRPPNLPTVRAVPGDKKVTLYWDDFAEESVDPILGEDFEGYVIYRSTEPDFGDIQTITDGIGSPFMSEPLLDLDGREARFDLDNDWRGFHPVQYFGRGVHYYLGNNTGVTNTYVDTNNVVNGQTYYYAVCAYDHGDSSVAPPTETTKKIEYDPINGKLVLDDNTVQVVPGPRASGYQPPAIDENDEFVRLSGRGNGDLEIRFLDDVAVEEDVQYLVEFHDSLVADGQESIEQLNYSLLRRKTESASIKLFGTKNARLPHQNIANDEHFKVTDADGGTTYLADTDFVFDFEIGAIRRSGDDSAIPDNGEVTVEYRYSPIKQSTRLDDEDGNNAFQGMRLMVDNHETLEPDTVNSAWSREEISYSFELTDAGTALKKVRYPADYKVSFSENDIDSAFVVGSGGLKTVPVTYSVEEVTPGVLPQRMWTLLLDMPPKNDKWDPGDQILVFHPNAAGLVTDTLAWAIIVEEHIDSIDADTTYNADSSEVTIDTLAIYPEQVAPTDGDYLMVKTWRPFSSEDAFTFTTKAASFNQADAKSRMDDIYVVPNPYVAYNEIEPKNTFPNRPRGERRIYFENLPPSCTIRIYTLTGELVRELRHESSIQSGREYWNLLSKDGFGVAYGVYFAHIEAPGVGEKIIKFAIIK